MASLDEIRALLLGLPDVVEAPHAGAPGFKADGRLFAVLRVAGCVTLKLDPEDQRNLIEGYPDVVRPLGGKGARLGNAGRAGWTFVDYAAGDADFVAGLLRLARASIEAPRIRRKRAR